MGNFSSTKKEPGPKFGGFSTDEVKQITTIFREVQGNEEKMDKLLFAQKLYLIVDPEEEGAKELENVFNFFDVDESGEVDIYKFICQLALLRQQTPQKKALNLFNIYAGKNRVMEKEELKSMLMTMQNTISKRDITMKANQKGDSDNIEERELHIIKLVNKYFAQYDQNRDGLLGFDEFRNMFLTEKSIIHRFMMNCNLISDEDQKVLDGIEQEEFDEDLQSEMNLINQTTNQEQNDRKNGIDHNVDPDQQFQEDQVNKGDQFMAHLANVRYSPPDDIEKIAKVPVKQLSSQPQQQLELSYVYGFKQDTVRNTVKYNSENQLIYPLAAVIVKLDQTRNTQKFNLDHSDDIISIDCHGEYVVTGQIGHKPLLCVWNSQKDESFLQIRGDLQKGINHVAFNEDGTKIVGAGMDEDHHLFVYDIFDCHENQSKGKPVKFIASGKGPKANILDLIYDGDQVITCCEKAVYFCQVNTKIGKVASKKGVFGNAPMCPIIAGKMFNNKLVTGNIKGQLYIWGGTSVSQVKPVHKGAILSIFNNKKTNQLITGGNDGKIMVFDKSMQTIKTIDLNNIGIDILKSDKVGGTVVIRSVCSNDRNDIVIGTRQGEIVEIKDYIKCNVVMKGHYDHELWGLACFVQEEWVVTVGEDGLLAIWDLHTRKQIKSKQIGFQAKTVDVNPEKTQIAVGCKNGQLLFFDTSLKKLQFKDNLKKEISIVKYSPKNSVLAVGVAPPISKVYIYKMSQIQGQQLQKIGCLVGSPSRIIHLDYSQDGKTIQLNNTSYELLYYDSTACTQLTSGDSQFKNEVWNTYSIIKGWGVQGIWPPASDGSDINSVARNNQRDVIITGDDWGYVKMFNYPCFNKKSQFNSYKGHSAHVTNVQFSYNDKYAISIGGADKAIFQWRYVNSDQAQSDVNKYQENMKQNLDEDDNKSVEEEEEEEFDFIKEDKVDVGDQRLAVDPAFGQIKASTPVGFKVNPKVHNVLPQGNLKLNHVIGHCCYDGYKNNVQLYNQNHIVMASAGLGVTMNVVTKEQDFFRDHDEDVISMALHPNNSIVATGQKAAKSKAKCINLFLWNIEDKQVIANFNKFHLREIQLLRFNKSGDRLLSIGKDDDNSVAIWNWSIQNLQCTSPVDKQGVRTVVWSSDTEFMTSGPKHIKFWQINGKNIRAKLGQFCGQVSTCAVYFKDKAVLGTVKGELVVYQGTQIQSKANGNCKGAVTQLLEVKEQLLVGGQDGKVSIFSLSKSKLEFISCLDITQFSKNTNYMITSLDYKFCQLLIATAGGDVFISNDLGQPRSENEVKFANDYKLVQQGHFKQELWGLAISPNSNRFVTCGDDQTVRLWDVSRKFEQVAIQTEFKSILRAVDWAPSGEFIIAADSKGMIYLLDAGKLDIVKSMQSHFKPNPKKRGDPWIEDLKISPDSKMCAFGAHGGNFHMQILNCGRNKLENKCVINTRISSALIHLDWCTDNSTIVINSQAYELMWFDVHSKKMSSPIKDYDQYYSWTCKVGFQSQGISQKGMDGSDINSVCRNTTGTCIASGDDNSKVCLYNYPSVVKNSIFKSYSGHSSHVTTVRFSRDDGWLISTGGYDKCILVWKTDFGKRIESIKAGNTNMIEQEDDENDSDNEDYSTDMVQKKVKTNRHTANTSQNVINGDIQDEFEVDIDAGDEFMAVKPWLGAIKQPSDFVQSKNASKKPSCSLQLDYVFGYRTKDMRNNVKQLKDGRVVFNAAALGIVLDTNDNTQTFFDLHIDDITALDVNADMKTVATGEIGPKPSIYLWDSDTKEKLYEFKGQLQKGINNVSFSPDGLNLVASAIDTENHIGVFKTDIMNRQFSFVNKFKSGGSYIVDLKMLNERQFVSVGKRFYKFWEQKSPGNYTGSLGQGMRDQKANVVYMCAIQNHDNKILVGSTKGSLLVFQGKVFSQELNAHSRSMDCLSQNADKSYFYSGSKDGTMIVWSNKLQQHYILDLNTVDKSLVMFDSGIRSIWNTNSNDKWIIGTYGGDIIEVKHKNQQKGSYERTLMNSHYTPNKQWTNEVWGLAPMTDNLYVTCSDDGTLRIWDRETRKQIKSTKTQLDADLKQVTPDPKTKDLRDSVKGRCVDVNQDQKTIAVGFKDGSVRVYDDNLEQKIVLKHAKEWISDVKFSPDGTKLAVGSHDNAIYVYDVEGYSLKKKKYKMNKHSSYITHFDWSEDSCYLHSTCGAYELLFWDVIGGKQMPGGASSLKDEHWHTWTTTLGFPVQGIWPKYADGTDINYVDRSSIKHPDGYHLVATGDDFGTLKILRYPSIVKNSDSVVGRGHSSHVTTVKFSFDDKFIYSAGGEDNCIFQWKVEMQ